MEDQLFLVKSIELEPKVILHVLFDKEMNYRENDSCYFKLEIECNEDVKYSEITKTRFVYKDTSPIEPIVNDVIELIQKVKKSVEAIDTGLNLIDDFYINFPGLSNSSIEVRREIKRSLGNITEYKLKPFIIELYTSVLIQYKGSDTLQYRKYVKGLQAISDAQQFNRGMTNGNFNT